METGGGKTAAFAVWFVPAGGWEQNSCFCSVVCTKANILQLAPLVESLDK